jgi:hypothetical protein
MAIDLSHAFEFFCFSCFGAGANWVLPTIMFQQIPYFQNNQPEELCISTYMNASVNCGLLMFFTFLFVNKFVRHIENKDMIPYLLGTTVLGTFFAAFVYSITVNGLSIFIYLSCFIGGSVGTLTSVVMNPFMSSFKNDFITAARFGGSGSILLIAIVSLGQQPGHEPPNFTPRVFILVFAFLMILSPLAYWYITRENIGRRTSEDKDADEKDREGEAGVALSILNDAPSSSAADERSAGGNGDKVGKGAGRQRVEGGAAVSFAVQLQDIETQLHDAFHTMVDVILVRREDLTEREKWLRFALPHMMAVGWVSFNTWGMLTAFIPFAMKNSLPDGDDGNGSVQLALAIQMAAVCLVAGDLSTKFVKLSIPVCLFVFTLFAIITYAAAIGAGGFQYEASGPLLIIVFALGRFFEAHITTSTYRTIATNVPAEFRSDTARAVGIAEQLMTTLGTICSTVIVSQTSSC